MNFHWEVLGEAIQTILRKEGKLNAYEKLKDMTQGEKLDEQSIIRFIKSLNRTNGSILEVGCGLGYVVDLIARNNQNLEVNGSDISKKAIQIAKKKFNKTQGCIAVKKKALIEILKDVKINTKVKIEHRK